MFRDCIVVRRDFLHCSQWAQLSDFSGENYEFFVHFIWTQILNLNKLVKDCKTDTERALESWEKNWTWVSTYIDMCIKKD